MTDTAQHATRRVDFDRDFHLWPTRDAWITWVTQRGLDPCNVAVPGYIDADDGTRTVTAECYVRDERGRMILNEAGDAAVREVVVVKLEARALRMPAVGRPL